jgi:hypothetical protein
MRSRISHPAAARRRRDVSSPTVLIVAEDERDRVMLKALLSATTVRTVSSCLHSEGRGITVVVIGGDFPLAELNEVRVHPVLFDKPVVLFAPGKVLLGLDWRSLNTWPVISEHEALHQLTGHVERLATRVNVGRPSKGVR